MATSKTDCASIEQFNQRFRERLKKSGFRVLGGSMFDKDETAKIVLDESSDEMLENRERIDRENGN